MRRLVPILLACLVLGCGDPLELSVDLRTDLRPGIELDRVQVSWSADGQTLGSETVDASAGRDFLRGERLVDIGGLAAGPHRIDVTAFLGDAVVGSRVTLVDLSADLAITVVLTRDCEGVACTASPLTACLDGQCVDPACRPGAPDACPAPSCASADDCPAPRVSCVRPECAARVCFEIPDDARCEAGERCDPLRGCVTGSFPDGGPRDGGATDAGTRDGAACTSSEAACADGADDDCDGLLDCADPDCAGASCDDADPCTHDDVCGSAVCAGTAITCTSDACATRSCNGTATCDEVLATDGTACTDDGNPCTNDRCAAGACAHPAVANGTSVGGFVHCCGGRSVDFSTDRANCGGCGLGCATGYGCTVYGGQPTCDCGAANSECQGGSNWVCSTSYGVCACLAGGCPGGSTCIMRSGPDYCAY